MINIKLEQEVKFREREMSKKLFELFDRLNKLPLKSQEEKFDIFRSYFRGMQDGFFYLLEISRYRTHRRSKTYNRNEN